MRVVVIGISGAGKSTLAGQLARALGARYVELDALFWDPGWTRASPEAFRARVEAATTAMAWVADGNYSGVRPLLWGRATHLVWLDYERPVIMARVIRRTLRRALSRQELWNGNRERWRGWLEPDHPIRWAWSRWRPLRASLETALADPAYAHLSVLRLRRPGQLPAARAALLQQAGAG
jgi:adenylate kinase family enzyme